MQKNFLLGLWLLDFLEEKWYAIVNFYKEAMTQEQLNTLLNLIRNTSNQAEDNELSATILQMAADSIALDKLKTIIPSATTAPSGNLAKNENGQSL